MGFLRMAWGFLGLRGVQGLGLLRDKVGWCGKE